MGGRAPKHPRSANILNIFFRVWILLSTVKLATMSLSVGFAYSGWREILQDAVNLFLFLEMKEFWKSAKNWSYHYEFGGCILLKHSVICEKFEL